MPRLMMNPDRMRQLDYWLGVPLCFLLTIVVKLMRLVLPRRPPAKRAAPRDVLLIELAEMGTVVLAAPAIAQLRTRYPDCRVHFLLFKQIEESVTVVDIIPAEHVLAIDASSLWTVCRDVFRFMRVVRRVRFDAVINFEAFTRFSMALTALSGAPVRVGFHPFEERGLYVGDLLTHRVIYNPHLHTSRALATLVDAITAPDNDLPLGKFPAPITSGAPRAETDDDARERIRARVRQARPAADGKRWIVVNPNASSLIPVRRWPLDRYAELVARLVEDPRNACLITGTASERETARFIVDRVPSERVVDLAGQTSLKELIDLFNVSSLLVTNDSGPAHLAALTGIRILVFFGPETPELYRPLSDRCTALYANFACSPCVSAYNHRRTVCTNNLCVQHFDVETVHGHIRRLLEQ